MNKNFKYGIIFNKKSKICLPQRFFYGSGFCNFLRNFLFSFFLHVGTGGNAKGEADRKEKEDV